MKMEACAKRKLSIIDILDYGGECEFNVYGLMEAASFAYGHKYIDSYIDDEWIFERVWDVLRTQEMNRIDYREAVLSVLFDSLENKIGEILEAKGVEFDIWTDTSSYANFDVQIKATDSWYEFSFKVYGEKEQWGEFLHFVKATVQKIA